MSLQKIAAALALSVAASATWAQGLDGGSWTHVLDMGNAAAYVNVNQPCAAGAQYGFKAFFLAPFSASPAVKNGSAQACVDFSKFNRQSTKFWIYIPGEEVSEVQTGVGQNVNGYPFEFKALASPGPASKNLTPMMASAIARAKDRQAKSNKRLLAYQAEQADKARRKGL